MTIPGRFSVLAIGLLLGGAAHAAGSPEPSPADRIATPPPRSWIESPYRRFGPPQPLGGARAVLLDEIDDAALRSALSAELRRLSAELYGRQGWRSPFADDEALKIYVARREGEGVRTVSARAVENGRLLSPALLIDGEGLSRDEIVREVARQIAVATLAAYGVADDPFLFPAACAALASGRDAGGDDLATIAAAPELDVRAHPADLGRLWVEEAVHDTGGLAFLRQVWERAAGTGEPPLPLLLRMIAEAGGRSEEAILARCAARLYAAVETEPAPSRLRLFDLEAGALDASPPEAMAIRHRSYVAGESDEPLRIAWPEDGGAGAAVIRYRDAELPPDVLFFAPGDARTIAISGVARVDWIVAGAPGGGRGIRAPAVVEPAEHPYSGLEFHAAPASAPRLRWSTTAHRGMWGWAVFREEVLPDGRIARTGPEIVPSSESADSSFGYVFVDDAASAGTFYRYTVWAVTDEGTLARAFSATLKTPE